LVVEAVTHGHTACHRQPGTIECHPAGHGPGLSHGPGPGAAAPVPARPWHNLAAQVNRRYLFDALGSVGHDFGIEIGGFRAPGI